MFYVPRLLLYLSPPCLTPDPQQERVIAMMTLGSVAFQMSLFYITNHRDNDIKRYLGGTVKHYMSFLFCSIFVISTDS